MRKFDLKDVQAFTVLASELSFTRTGIRLGLSQPQLSLRIRQFEEKLGYRVFDRSSRQVTLTRRGEDLLLFATALMTEAERFGEACLKVGAGHDTEIKVGASDYFNALRRSLLRDFMDTKAGIMVRTEGTARDEDGIGGVLSGRLDMAFVLHNPRYDLPRLEAIVLARAHMGVLLPECHPLAASPTLSAMDLRGQDIVLFDRDHWPALHDQLASYINESGAVALRLPEVAPDAMALRCLETGAGLLCIPWWINIKDRPPGLIHRTLQDLDLSVEFLLVRRRGAENTAGDSLWRYSRRTFSQSAET